MLYELTIIAQPPSSLTTLGQRVSMAVMLFLLVSITKVYADTRVELYQSQQLVLDQSTIIRQQATAAGLAETVIRVSGDAQSINHPQIKTALTQANQYLTRYSYESTNEQLAIAGDYRPASRILLQFSATAIQELLQTAQIPTWPERRPEILLWVVSDQDNKQLLDSSSPETQALKKSSKRWGLPLSTPLLDLTDRQTLPASHLWAMDEQTIREASMRYEADGILAGRLIAVSTTLWQARFLLIHNNKSMYLSSNGNTLQQAAREIVHQVSRYFSRLQGVIISDHSATPSMTIVVKNIDRFDAYARLLTYLNSLTIVADTMVNAVHHRQLTLTLSYHGNKEQLLSVLSASNLLTLTTSANSEWVSETDSSISNVGVTTTVSSDSKGNDMPVTAIFSWISTQ